MKLEKVDPRFYRLFCKCGCITYYKCAKWRKDFDSNDVFKCLDCGLVYKEPTDKSVDNYQFSLFGDDFM